MDKSLDFLVTNFWPIAGSILLACFVAWLGYRTVYHGRRAGACAAFRTTLNRELLSLLSSWPSNIDTVLISRYPVIESAVREFRYYVPWWRRHSFDRAWFIYLHGSDGTDRSHYYQYMGYSSPDRVIPDSKATFEANVNHLRSFANET